MGGSSSENSSSEESDHHLQQEVQDLSSSVVTKRSYDCTFCKRGFTNARALGGHMNIHRKERIKAKKSTPIMSSSFPKSFFTNEESMVNNDPFVPEASRYYCILETHQSQSNYEMYFRPSSSPPNHINNPSDAYTFQYEFLNLRNQDLLGANLSLQIGTNHAENDQVRREFQEDGEGVDLELRLGHDPYSNC